MDTHPLQEGKATHILYIFINTYLRHSNDQNQITMSLAHYWIYDAYIDIWSKDMFNTMNWMPFYDKVTYKRCLMMYKVNTNLVPQQLQSVTPVTSVHTHNTWSAARGALYTYIANLHYYTIRFKYEGARLWNNLDTYIKFAPSITSFKQRYLKDYFKV